MTMDQTPKAKVVWPKWSAADDKRLSEQYATAYTPDLARELGRTVGAVYRRAKTLRLHKPQVYAPDHQPHNALPVGSVTKAGRGYRFIKVRAGGWPDAWRAEHQLIWEATNGPVPDGHVLTFKDGNYDNVALENLELVAVRDWMHRYGVHALPPDLAALIRTRAALVRLIRGRDEEQPEESHA